MILESADLSRENERLVNKLYRQASNNFKRSNYSALQEQHADTLIEIQSLAVNPVKKVEIGNLFASFESFENLTEFSFFDHCLISPQMSNLYMFIEGLCIFVDRIYDNNSKDIGGNALMTKYWTAIFHTIEYIRLKKNWKKVSPEYLSNYASGNGFMAKYASGLRTIAPDIVSQTNDTCKLVGKIIEIAGSMKNELHFSYLFSRHVRLAYYLPQYCTTKLCCSESGYCGFILETEPVLKDGNPHKFRAYISYDTSKYPDDLHAHPEIIDINEMHLMVSAYNHENDFTKMLLHPCSLSWNANGVQIQEALKESLWYLDPFWFETGELVELVVFM